MSGGRKRNEILLVIPAFNEEENILEVTEKVRGRYDFIVINVASTDGTEEILRKKKILHLTLEKNSGIFGAVREGLRYAREKNYRVIVQFDGDGQHDVESVKEIVKPILEGEASLIIGSRFLENKAENFRSSKIRRIGIKIISDFIKLKTGRRIFDATSGFRAIDRELGDFLMGEEVEYMEAPITVTAALVNGYKIKEVSAKMFPRKKGKSSFTVRNGIMYMIRVPIKILGLKKRGRGK